MQKLGVAIVVAAMLVPGLAMAQVKQEPQRKTLIDFGDHELNIDRDRPDGDYLVAIHHPKFPSLIKLRANFNNELKTSVESLR